MLYIFISVCVSSRGTQRKKLFFLSLLSVSIWKTIQHSDKLPAECWIGMNKKMILPSRWWWLRCWWWWYDLPLSPACCWICTTGKKTPQKKNVTTKKRYLRWGDDDTSLLTSSSIHSYMCLFFLSLLSLSLSFSSSSTILLFFDGNFSLCWIRYDREHNLHCRVCF